MEFPWNDSLPSRRMRDRKRGTLHVQGRVPRVEQAPRDVVGWRQSRCRFEEVFQLCLPYVELVCQARAGQAPSKVRGNVSADEIDSFAVFASQGYAAMLVGAERRMLHDERDDFRDRSDAERRSLLQRHSVDFVVERNAKMFGAPIPQDSVFLECHSG